MASTIRKKPLHPESGKSSAAEEGFVAAGFTPLKINRMMIGMRELLAALIDALEKGLPCVYCSVVETRGSTPQKAGAAMLVFANGAQVGTLGGGCVEAEVKRKALLTLASADGTRAELHTFSLDDNYGWDDGLICGGRIEYSGEPRLGARRSALLSAAPRHCG